LKSASSFRWDDEQKKRRLRNPQPALQKLIACEAYSALGTIASVVMRSVTSSLTFGT
jgi:hypothetical protein